MAEKQITGLGQHAAPLSRRIKDSELYELLAVNATFDGSGAAGDFVPTVEIVSDSGEVVGRFPADTAVTAGDSAEVTFAPFLRNGRGDIRFNRRNVGGYIDIETSTTGPFAVGVYIASVHGTWILTPNATQLYSVGSGLIQLDANGGSYILNVTGGTASINAFNGDVQISTGPGGTVEIDGGPVTLSEHVVLSDHVGNNVVETTANTRLAFFNVAPVAQQATPVTLANVIALLQAYGLAA